MGIGCPTILHCSRSSFLPATVKSLGSSSFTTLGGLGLPATSKSDSARVSPAEFLTSNVYLPASSSPTSIILSVVTMPHPSSASSSVMTIRCPSATTGSPSHSHMAVGGGEPSTWIQDQKSWVIAMCYATSQDAQCVRSKLLGFRPKDQRGGLMARSDDLLVTLLEKGSSCLSRYQSLIESLKNQLRC